MLSDDRNAFSGFIQIAAAEEMKEDEDFPESLSLFHTESLLVSSPAVAGASETGIQSSLKNSLAGTRDNAAFVSTVPVPSKGAGGVPTKGNTHLVLKRIRIISLPFQQSKL
jgi:hypothetical protein